MGNFLSGENARLIFCCRASGAANLINSDFCHMTGKSAPFSKGGRDAF